MSRFFIGRPIVAIVIAIILVIVGVVSFLSLPVAQYPNIVPPEIVVSGTYVGADALTVEQAVATPIEQQMSGVDHMSTQYHNSGDRKRAFFRRTPSIRQVRSVANPYHLANLHQYGTGTRAGWSRRSSSETWLSGRNRTVRS